MSFFRSDEFRKVTARKKHNIQFSVHFFLTVKSRRVTWRA